MQRAEMEELRHREANNTALQAIGPRKKLKLDPEASASTVSGTCTCKLSPKQTENIFLDCNKWNPRNSIRNKSSRSDPPTHQACEHARHDFLHGAGKGQLSQHDAVQGLSQVINRWPAQMVQRCCYVFLLTV